MLAEISKWPYLFDTTDLCSHRLKPSALSSYFFESRTMKASVHPEYKEIKVTCSCGNEFQTGSALCQDLNIEVCSQCHPFYTGKQKLVDTGGRVKRFMDRYNRK